MTNRHTGYYGVIGVFFLATAHAALAAPPETAFAINYPWWASVDDASTRQMSAKAGEAGFGWIRLYLPWGAIEKKRGIRNWGNYGLAIDNAFAAGLSVEVILVHPTPCWASPKCSACAEADNGCRPADPIYFSDFATAAAERFGGEVAAWGLWQEPNAPEQWAGTDRREAASEYQRLLLVPGYNAIKKVSRNALITAPGVVSWDECVAHDPNSTSITPLVEPWVTTGARTLTVALDALTIHRYGTSSEINSAMDCTTLNYQSNPLCSGAKCPPFWLEEFAVNGGGCSVPAEDPMMTATKVWDHSGTIFTNRFYWLLQGVPPGDCGYNALFHNDLSQIGEKFCTLKRYLHARNGMPLQPGDTCWDRGGCGQPGLGSCTFGDLRDGRPIRVGRFTDSGRDQLLFWDPDGQTYWLGRVSNGQLRFNYAGSTVPFGGIEAQSLNLSGDFTGSGKTETLFWPLSDQNYWLGKFSGDQLGYQSAGNSSAFGGAEANSLLWTGKFSGSGKTELLFWYPGDQNYWLGKFTGDTIGYLAAGNSSLFGGAEAASLIWTGDFTGSAKTQTLFWYPGDQTYWLGQFTDDQIGYTWAGNTSVFGGVESASRMWTGSFTGSGRTELLLWYPPSRDYWLGRFTDQQIGYTRAGNTSPFGGVEASSLFWAGDFSGSGKTELLFWYPGDQNYWLGQFTGDQIGYTRVGNTTGFGGAESASMIWVGQFSGTGKTELLMWFPGDGNWWLGRVVGGQFAYSLVANTGATTR